MSKPKVNLEKKLAEVEFINDQLISEISYINNLLLNVGFIEGLTSLKEAVQEILEQDN